MKCRPTWGWWLWSGDELCVVYGRRAGGVWICRLYNPCVAPSARSGAGRLWDPGSQCSASVDCRRQADHCSRRRPLRLAQARHVTRHQDTSTCPAPLPPSSASWYLTHENNFLVANVMRMLLTCYEEIIEALDMLRGCYDEEIAPLVFRLHSRSDW